MSLEYKLSFTASEINDKLGKIDEIDGTLSQKADASSIPTKISQLENDSNFITLSDVDTKVSGLVDSAPETLNTLNELAAALGDDPNFATTIAGQIGGKVDKIEGKGLSTNDYTTTEKNKLAGIATGAEVNVNADWNATSGDAQILNKPTLGSLASKSTVAKSDLASDVQTSLNKANSALQSFTETDPTVPAWAKAASKPSYTYSEVGAAAASHGTHVTYSTTTPKAAGTAAVGSATTVSRSDHVHPAQTTVSGNAGSATKLATARTIRTNLASTSTASFDGSANVTPGVTGTLPVANGGTGKASYTANRLIYPSASTTLAQLAFPSVAGSVLRQGTSGAPYWTSIADLKTALGVSGSQMTIVSYTGTGKTGASNPNSLTFPFAPAGVCWLARFDIITASSNSSLVGLLFKHHFLVTQWENPVRCVSGLSTNYYYMDGLKSSTGLYMKRSSDGKTIYWYSEQSEAEYQMNTGPVNGQVSSNADIDLPYGESINTNSKYYVLAWA